MGSAVSSLEKKREEITWNWSKAGDIKSNLWEQLDQSFRDVSVVKGKYFSNFLDQNIREI